MSVNAMVMSVPVSMKVETSSGIKYLALSSNEINRGGEGRILTVNEDSSIVLKIYHPTINPISEKRFKELSKLDPKFFVKPKELIYHKGSIVGFSMEYLGSEYFTAHHITQKDFCLSNSITKEWKLKVSKGISEAIENAHINGIVIGDLNLYNIMLNKSGDVKLIDVDSYQTPSYPHSGVMMDDVRDYYYGGIASKNSDMFAHSVFVFQSLSYVHPFKGFHPKFKKISERMTQKLPVICGDSSIKIPGFYEPISDNNLLNQLKDMYMGSVRRFMIDLSQKPNYIVGDVKPDHVIKHEEDELSFQNIFTGLVMSVFVNDNRLLIETKDKFNIYNLSGRGIFSLVDTIDKALFDKVFVSTAGLFGLKDGFLHIKPFSGSSFVKNQFINLSSYVKIQQFGNVLLAIGDGAMMKIDLSTITGNLLKYTVDNVFTKAFNLSGGIFFRAGERVMCFSPSKSGVDMIPLPFNIKSIYQDGSLGMASFTKKVGKSNTLVHKYFRISGREIVFSNRDADDMYRFGHMKASDGSLTIFQPQDGFIRVIQPENFNEIIQYKASFITSQSTIKGSPAGIIAWEGNGVWLINKK